MAPKLLLGKQRRLWEGSWDSGSIEVPGLSDYRLVAARPDDTEFWLLGWLAPGAEYVTFSGVLSSGTPNLWPYSLRASVDGDTLSLVYAGYYNLSTQAGIKPFTVSEVWGVL